MIRHHRCLHENTRTPSDDWFQLQQLPDGQAVLNYQNLPPARVRLLPWFRDRRFRHLRTPARRTEEVAT